MTKIKVTEPQRKRRKRSNQRKPKLHNTLARRLYLALVDPHLIHGCEISLDVDEAPRKKLEAVQHGFLRRALGLNSQTSMLAPLFTETAIMPLRYRRVILALKYLRYLLALPADRYAHCALRDSLALAEGGHASWALDLLFVLTHLPFPLDLPDLSSITAKGIDALIREVQSGAEKHLQGVIDSSPKLYLLRDRLEPNGDKRPRHQTLYFRHYLSVPNRDHRVALTRVLLSDHAFSLERLRWLDPRRPRILPDLRLCRYCEKDVESPEHALLVCTACHQLTGLRDAFIQKIALDIPTLGTITPSNAAHLLRALLTHRKTVNLLAKFAYDVVAIYAAKQPFTPALPLHWLIDSGHDG